MFRLRRVCLLGIVLALGWPAVASADGERAVSFRNEVMAVLSRAGCNQGACHGNLNGKGGFKLSLRGQDPDLRLRRPHPRHAGPAHRPPPARRQPAPAQGDRPRAARGRPALRRRQPRVRHPAAAGSPQGLRPTPPGTPTLDAAGGDAAPRRSCVEPADASHRPRRRCLRRRHAQRRDRPGGLRVVQPEVDGRRDGRGPQRRARRDDHPGPLPRPAGDGAARLRAGPARLRLERAARRQLHRRRTSSPSCRSCACNPSDLCTDSEFLRRAYLDLLGLLPTPDETRALPRRHAAGQAGRLIDALLERPEFADFWALQVVRPAAQRGEGARPQGRAGVPRLDSPGASPRTSRSTSSPAN